MPGGIHAPRYDAPRVCTTMRLTPTVRTCARQARNLRTAAVTECALDCIFACAAVSPPAWGFRPREAYAKPFGRAGNAVPRARLRGSATIVGVQGSTILARLSPMVGRSRGRGMRLPRDYGGRGRSRLPGVTSRAEPMKRLLAPRQSTFGSTRTISPTREWEWNPLRRDLLLWCILGCKGLLLKN